MEGLMMNIPLTTNYILEYGNRVFPHKKIITKNPDGSMHYYTYHDMYKRTMQLANALVNKLGINPGERIATFAWNHYQHLELYYGIPATGAVCHPLNLRLSVDQITYIANHAEDQAVFVDATLLPLFEKVAQNAKTIKHYILLNAPRDVKTSIENYIHYEDLLEGESEEFTYPEIDENSAMGMCYTSGTTGDPKGALYSHRATYLHAQALTVPNAVGMSANETILLIVPQFHVMAWGFPFSCVMAGSNMVLPGPHLQPKALIEIVETEKVTIANGVPTIWMGVYEELKKNPKKLDSFKMLAVGGAAMPKALTVGFMNDLGIEVVHAWGMTETSPLGTASRLQTHHFKLSEEEQFNVLAKQGVEIAGIDIRIKKDDGTVAPRDGKTVGEIEVRGNWVISEYYKAESDNFSKDGWFKTGDVGNINNEGYMHITDRKKDLIKSGGEWISSLDLENSIMAHPLVKEAAVIAIPDEKWTERPLAAVVTVSDEKPDVDALKEKMQSNFAKYQIPDKFIFIDEVPKTSVGKFDKKKLRQMFAEGKLK
ncbi:MAG: long-chain fatty acid--CoA ligase [Bacteroidota bacterium]